MKSSITFRHFLTMTLCVWAASCLMVMPDNCARASAPVVGLWRFNEGSGTNVTDSSGFGNNGTFAGENGNVPAWVAGKPGFGGALQFTNDGFNHAYVTIPGSASLQVGLTATNPWTMTAWAYETSDGSGNFVANYGRILVTDNGEAFQLESGANGDDQLYTWSQKHAAWEIGWGPIPSLTPLLDQWVHWAVVYDGTNLMVYRNGNQGAQGGFASTNANSALSYGGYTGSVLIGSETDQLANRTWNGMLDDIAIFAGALSQTEIQTVMAGDFSAFIGGPAKIVNQPFGLTVDAGANASFTVVARGQPPITYQWNFNGTNVLAGATNATLSLTNVQLVESGDYSVIVSNSLGFQLSQPAPLVVNVLKPVLVGLWRFNESSGTNVIDSSGLNNNGSLAGENGNVPARVAGQPGFGGALEFTNNGTDHAYVTIPGSQSLQIGQTATNPWSITAWAYESSNGTTNYVASYGRIVVLDNGEAFQFESGESGDAQIYTWSRQNIPYWQIGWGTSSSLTPLLDRWVHWALVYDGTNLTIYRNGDQGPWAGIATTNVSAPLGYSGYSGAVLIGSELAQQANRTWNGMIDDVAIFNIALSQADITNVMKGDFTRFIVQPHLSLASSQTNITLSWPSVLAGFQLQSASSLASRQWTNVALSPVLKGSFLTVSPPIGAAQQFFRLRSP